MTGIRRGAAVLVMAATTACAGGCGYLADRGADLLDIVDAGVTLTSEPSFSLYYRLPVPVAGALEGKADGVFLGIGGGNAGLMRHHHRFYGTFLSGDGAGPDAFWSRAPVPLLLSGVEEAAFGDFDKANPEHVRRHPMGLFPMLRGDLPDVQYACSCQHYVHVLFVGALLNLRYNECLDFVLGFSGLDISGDDHRPRGYWPWEAYAPFGCKPDALSRTYVGRSRWALEPAAAPPEAGAPSAPEAPQRTHVVQSGETLRSISRKYYGTDAQWEMLHRVNLARIGENPYLLKPGTVLVIPPAPE
jgi:hypothetical protein